MTPELLLGLVLAVASTVVLDVGYLFQQRDAARLPPIRIAHPMAAARGLLRARGWVLGVGLTAVGFALYVVALTFADISLVQAAAASGVALLALIAARFFGARLTRWEWTGVAVATLGLLAIGLSLIGHDDSGRERASVAGVLAWIVPSAIVALLLLSPPAARLGPAGALGGLGAGLLFGAADVATKGLMVTADTTAAGIAASPFIYALIALYGLGFVAQQLAFQRGEAVASIGVMVAATNVSPIIAGVWVFGDPLPDDPLGLTLRLGGFALAIAGSVMLARVSEGGGSAAPAPAPAR
ncbi:MAG: DMT family transporter [Thermoleophilia bacterium]|nr:DMT family transporter [Thermoleophilia bacterium]